MAELGRGGSTASEPSAPLLLLLLLVLTLLAGAGAASVCDTANCGKGSCTEAPGLLPPNYECQCDAGWSHALKPILFSPCIVPNCSFDSSCLKLNLSLTPPIGKLPDVCDVVSCGAGGACKTGDAPFSYSCECRPGYANLLNLTGLPCVNCFLGSECYALGLGPPPPPPSSSPPAPSGSVPSGTLLQLQLLLLLSIVAVVQVL